MLGQGVCGFPWCLDLQRKGNCAILKGEYIAFLYYGVYPMSSYMTTIKNIFRMAEYER